MWKPAAFPFHFGMELARFKLSPIRSIRIPPSVHLVKTWPYCCNKPPTAQFERACDLQIAATPKFPDGPQFRRFRKSGICHLMTSRLGESVSKLPEAKSLHLRRRQAFG